MLGTGRHAGLIIGWAQPHVWIRFRLPAPLNIKKLRCYVFLYSNNSHQRLFDDSLEEMYLVSIMFQRLRF